MFAACTSPAPDRDAGLDALSEVAWRLRPPAPHERAAVLRGDAALLLDGLLVRVARGRGALDVATGELLASLADGDRALRLGYSGIGDYARERLGIAPRTAQSMARLARELRVRPLLRDAVRRGELSARKAQAVLPLARGDAEAEWSTRARTETVRALEAAAREASAVETEPPESDDDWERIAVALTPEQRATTDEALAVAGKLLGATAPVWQRVEVICQEFLGTHAQAEPSDDERVAGGLVRGPVAEWLESAKAALEEETRRWAFLDELAPVVAPVAAPVSAVQAAGDASLDAAAVDAELRRLTAMRDRWDELLGHLALLVRMLGLWRDLQFCSFAHYCTERLGMAARTVEQRVALERRLHALPALRVALRERRVSYEQARLVARAADEASVDGWIASAEGTTCLALARELDEREEAQMCARGELGLRVPVRVGALLGAAIRAAREVAGRWLNPGEALACIATHFLSVWRPAVAERSTLHGKVLARDRGLCQVPGCSRAAAHNHHVLYRSHGGSDDPENLVALCAAHHLHGVHRGWVRVHGRAPDGLRWQLGCDVADRSARCAS
jgi:hypothetical protein